MRDLSEIRTQIDSIDQQILELVQQRMDLMPYVAEYKAATGKPIYDRTRERANIQRAIERVEPELAGYAAILETVLMEAARDAQSKRLSRRSRNSLAIQDALACQPPYFPEVAHVACQGVEGAYQQIAADRLFHRAQISFFSSFDEVFDAVEKEQCQFGIVPLENSTAGSVTSVYDLMMRHSFYIARSCRLKIDHNLLAPAGVRKEDVRVIYSHEQAIKQCAAYIASIPNCQVHVCENTATAAAMVARSQRTDVAAIASRDCAPLYGLDIIDQAVQDKSNNYTRFACISKDLVIYPGADRTSLLVITKNEPGSLFKVLARFFALDINLIKLEVRPIPGRDFESMFYLDIDCPVAAPKFARLMDSIEDVCDECRYLGSYSEVL